MKKYRVKIETPMAPKGTVLNYFFADRGTWIADVKGPKSFAVDHPEKYPDLFEPIREKTPEERVAEWLCKNFNRFCKHEEALYFMGERLDCNSAPIRAMASNLIASGLDPDKLEAKDQ